MAALNMSEAELQGLVLAYCLQKQVLVYHTHDSRRSQPGFPDLTMVGDRGILYAELKREEKSNPTVEQLLWAEALTNVDQRWQLWRPRAWLDGTIQRQINTLGRCTPYSLLLQERAQEKARAMLASRNERLQRG